MWPRDPRVLSSSSTLGRTETEAGLCAQKMAEEEKRGGECSGGGGRVSGHQERPLRRPHPWKREGKEGGGRRKLTEVGFRGLVGVRRSSIRPRRSRSFAGDCLGRVFKG